MPLRLTHHAHPDALRAKCVSIEQRLQRLAQRSRRRALERAVQRTRQLDAEEDAALEDDFLGAERSDVRSDVQRLQRSSHEGQNAAN